MVDVKEGFLCPICMKDLGDIPQLQLHFEEEHSKEDPLFLQNVKELFGKAKKKILSTAAVASTARSDDDRQQGFLSFSSMALTLGQDAKSGILGGGGGGRGESRTEVDAVSGVHISAVSRPSLRVVSHTGYFCQERKRRLERNKSTNQVLIRLEKLMRDLPTDPSKRRAHEQAVVPWIDEEVVKLCPCCAKMFNLARRKHHCRLCGSVICSDCSTGVDFEFAERVLHPATISKFEVPSAADQDVVKAKKEYTKENRSLGSKLIERPQESLNSLKSLVDQKLTEPQFRSCHLCRSILDRQERRSEAATSEPVLLFQFFQRLQEHMREGREQAASYKTAVESLHRGEEDHELHEAKRQRVKLLKIAEDIDAMSRRIAKLDTEPEATSPAVGLRLQLQQRIRHDAVNFVKATLVGMPDVPTEEEYAELKRSRIEAAAKRVQEERLAARAMRQRFEQEQARREKKVMTTSSSRDRLSPNHTGPSKAVNYDQGFMLTSSANNSFTSSDDPMVLQILNIREYIKEAKRLNKFEEVKALEENLKELQLEYQRSQHERDELAENYAMFKNVFHKNSPMKPEASQPNLVDESTTEEQEHVDIDDYDASGKNPFVDGE